MDTCPTAVVRLKSPLTHDNTPKTIVTRITGEVGYGPSLSTPEAARDQRDLLTLREMAPFGQTIPPGRDPFHRRVQDTGNDPHYPHLFPPELVDISYANHLSTTLGDGSERFPVASTFVDNSGDIPNLGRN